MSTKSHLASIQHAQTPSAVTPDVPDDLDDLEQKNDSTLSTPPDPFEEEFGHLITVDGDKVKLNQPAIAAKFARDMNVRYSEDNSQFHAFDSDEGFWKKIARKVAMWMVTAFLKTLADTMKVPELLLKRTPALMNGILQFVEGHALMGAPPPPSAKLVPVANGVLDLSGPKPALREYRMEDFFKGKHTHPYVPGAKCERFLNELLRPALPDPADVKFLQRDFGRQLVDGNDAQTITLLVGQPGSGKTILMSSMEKMLIPERFGYLRPDQLTGRFETYSLRGKSILVGKDVKTDYLDNDGAPMLKSLTGADRIESEKKYGGKFSMRGEFYVTITANSKPLIKIQGDAKAWRRRVRYIDFSREIPAHIIPKFDEVLIREEGVGILSWLVDGYMAHQEELREHGTLTLTEAHQKRVDDWLMESEGVNAFVRAHIVKKPGNVTVQEIWQAYTKFASARGWHIPSQQKFFTKLPEVMLELFGVERDNHITRDKAAVRGFNGVKFIGEDEVA
jgi:P4 family phage/plasmid primase-like protien